MMLNGEITNLDKNAPEDNTLLSNKQDEVEVQGGKIILTTEEQNDSGNHDEGDGQAALPAIHKDADPDVEAKKPRVSQRKLEANRKNGKKGGVRTPQGKAVSRLNAVKHGLLCRDLVLPGEDQSAFAELQARLTADLQPVGKVEDLLVFRIAACVWRLDRVQRVETALLQKNMEQLTPSAATSPNRARSPLAAYGFYTENLQRNLRYETAIEKQLFKALNELQRLQLARKGVALPAPIAVDLSVTKES